MRIMRMKARKIVAGRKKFIHTKPVGSLLPRRTTIPFERVPLYNNCIR